MMAFCRKYDLFIIVKAGLHCWCAFLQSAIIYFKFNIIVKVTDIIDLKNMVTGVRHVEHC